LLALGDFLVLEAVRSTNGTCLAVAEADILNACHLIAKTEGVWISPEGFFFFF